MIKEILDPSFIDKKTAAIQAILRLEARRIKAGDAIAAQRAHRKGVTRHDLEAALAALEAARSPDSERAELTWIPRDPTLCLLQSTLTETYLDLGATGAVVAEGFARTGEFVPVTNVSLLPQYAAPVEVEAFDQYGDGDPLFATGFALARELQLLRGKHRFPQTPPTVGIKEKARVILFGDWGSGLPRAQDLSRAVEERLKEAPDRDRHVIHLGDVYYAGFRKEYSRNVLGYWPVKRGQAIGSWALNGNHDMYTGGGPYFETMLGDSRFGPQAGASHFCLENNYWQILALDTSYEAPDWRGDKAGLYGDQAEWVARTRRAASQKGGILLSHHQLFSPWEGQSDLLFRKLGPVLDENLVKAWFWGHEHRCAIYKPMHNIEYPCLVGHAGVPVRFKGVDDYSAVQWQWNDKIDYDGNSYATLGLVVLDFNDKALDISFYNERGRKVDTGRREHLELV